MKSLFGSIKNAYQSAKKTVKQAVTKVSNAAKKYGGMAKQYIIKGAKTVTKAVVSGSRVLNAKCKSALKWVIKHASKLVGTLYHKIWGDHIDFYNDLLLSLLPGGFIIRGLNKLGATNIKPLNWLAKVLARQAFKLLDKTLYKISEKTEWDAKKFATETFMFGFKYDYKQGITYTDPNAPQKYAGYTPVYDLASKDIGFNISAQIITFEYNGKEYMVETWKGDYWGAAGSEIGLYSRKKGKKSKDPYFYDCATDEPMNMKSTLYRGNKKLYSREENHWWLTGFKPGEYAKPEELTMKCEIEFPNSVMAIRFVKGLNKVGTATKINRTENTVSWEWDQNHTRPIEEVVRDYTGGKSYDELLDGTLNEWIDRMF